MAKRHWNKRDFVVRGQSAAYDSKGGTNKTGYCGVCGCDMQSFARNGKDGPILHYRSHKFGGPMMGRDVLRRAS
jgi:hypothetical protein